MDAGGCRETVEQEQRAVTGSVVADELGSVKYRSKGVDMIKVCLDECIAIEPVSVRREYADTVRQSLRASGETYRW